MTHTALDETQQVIDWRIECMNKAGVEPAVSQLLAISPADLHKILDTHGRGCSDALLLQIYDSDDRPPINPISELDDPARRRIDPLSKPDEAPRLPTNYDGP